tara:strand:+ start:2692 stop:3498 length:807 start_codon:yes stop_codon:yes gene_type:complete
MISNTDKVDLLLRYSGGKYYALKQLSKFWIEKKHETYIEPFFGGGSVFWTKPKAKINWINDYDKDLIHFLNFIKNENNLKKLLLKLNKEKTPTKERHQEVKNIDKSDALTKAFKYFYLNRTSFSGKMNNPHWGFRPIRSLPIERWHERLIPCSKKLKNVKITNLSFEHVLKNNLNDKNTLVYLDPPYYKPPKNSHYKISFENRDHLKLLSYLKKMKTKFFLSYDDSAEIREMYKDFKISEIKFYYRVTNSRNVQNKRLKKKELVISNF